MFGNPSPLMTPYNYSKTNPDMNKWYSQNPQEVELMMKQKFQQPMNPNLNYNNFNSNPYADLQNELANCSINVRNKIIADKEYQICDSNCEMLIRQAMEEVFIPQILNTPNGRIEMEKFVAVVKNLKEKYTQEEAKTNEQLQMLLNDDVVRKRMEQLSGQTVNNSNQNSNHFSGKPEQNQKGDKH